MLYFASASLAELVNGRCAVLGVGEGTGACLLVPGACLLVPGAFAVGRICDYVWINGLATLILVCAAQQIGRL